MAESHAVARSAVHAEARDAQQKRRNASQKLDSKGRAYATGRRKECGRPRLDQAGRRQDHHQQTAREVYFARPVLRMILQPLIAANRDGQFDVIVTVKGGGLSGQAGAVRHGIAARWSTTSRRCAAC